MYFVPLPFVCDKRQLFTEVFPNKKTYDDFYNVFYSQILNPLDAICDRKRPDAVCVSNLKNAKKVDKGVLVERPDVKIFLPFRFYVYEPKTLFIPNTYNRFLGTCTIIGN